MKPALLIVDDDPVAMLSIRHPMASERFDSEAIGRHARGQTQMGYVGDIEDCDALLDWLRTNPAAQEARPRNWAVILDLRFAPSEYSPSERVREEINRHVNDDPRLATILADVDRDCHGGMAVLLAIANSPWMQHAVVLVASGAGYKGFPQLLEHTRIRHAGKFRGDLAAGQTAADPRNHKALLTNLDKLWRESFPDFHPTPWVDRFISRWLESYRSMPDSHRAAFCLHSDLDPPDAERKREAVSRYATLFREMCGSASELITDDSSLKALFQLVDSRVEPPPYGSDNRFEEWPHNTGDSDRKWIRKDEFGRIMQAIGKPARLRPEVPEKMRLPIMPGFTFVAALKVLFEAMAGQGILGGDDVVLRAESGLYRLSIPLTNADDHVFGIAKRWVSKIERGMLLSTAGSVCTELWNLSLARVSDVKFDSERAESELGKKLAEGQRELLRAFEGPGRPVAAVGFAPHHIHLHWS